MLKEIRDRSRNRIPYLDTKEDPADLAFHGKSMDEMVTNDLWWYIPKWFHQPEVSLPNGNVKIINQNTLLELANQSNGPTVLR